MPGSPLDLVSQRVPTVLGPLVIALPPGAVLEPDPGVVEGTAWWWSPRPGAAVLTVSHGGAARRTPAHLLELERSLEHNSVVVLRDESGEGVHRLDFLVARPPSRPFTTGTASGSGPGGHGHPVAASGPGGATQRACFRFWQRGGSALRVGYRLDESADAQWRATLDDILDSAHLS